MQEFLQYYAKAVEYKDQHKLDQLDQILTDTKKDYVLLPYTYSQRLLAYGALFTLASLFASRLKSTRKHLRNVFMVSVVGSVVLVPEAINPFLIKNKKENYDPAYLKHYGL